MAVEIERKYEPAAPDAPLPDLSPVAEVRALDDEHRDAVYHDTADLRLARTKATLRRRTGGRDAGWHLKLPAATGRLELSAPGRSKGVPKQLAPLVRSRVRGADLVPVVRLRTHRQVRQLCADDGRVLAELADDRVTAEVLLDPPTTSVWREVEVELVDGDEAVLDAVEALLLEAGVRPATSASKLRQALGDRLDAEPTGPPAKSAGAAVVAHLREQVDELVARDPQVRRDEHDAVHKMRVATRRLRSALKTFRPLLDRSVTDPLRDELRHLAGVLGEARDAEVLRDRFLEAVAAEPVELVLGPVVQRITDELGGQHRTAHAAVVGELDGDRYLRLLDALHQLVSDPPLTDRAERRAKTELPALVRRSWRRLRAAHDAAAAASGEARDHLLHEVRKAAKQARYAGEAVAPVVGRRATRFAERAEAVQEALGEHQDSVVARAVLRRLAVQAHLARENAFTFGRLHGLEQSKADAALRAFEPAWGRLERRGVLAWLG